MTETIKLIDALNSINKDDSNVAYIDFPKLYDWLDLCHYWSNYDKLEKNIKGYWLTHKLCTDTHVGIIGIFYQDKLIGISQRLARKSDIKYHFINSNCKKELKTFLLSCVETDEEKDILNSDEIIDLYYSFPYASNLLSKYGYYENKKCKIIRKINNNQYLSNNIEIEILETGKQLIIEVSEFKIKLHINDQ